MREKQTRKNGKALQQLNNGSNQSPKLQERQVCMLLLALSEPQLRLLMEILKPICPVELLSAYPPELIHKLYWEPEVRRIFSEKEICLYSPLSQIPLKGIMDLL